MKKTLFLILVIFISCQNNIKVNDFSIINIDKSDLKQRGNLSELISDIKFIPLETNDNNLLMEISKVVYYDKCFYVIDESLNKIIRFDQNGNFLNQIGKSGQGPGEFLEVRDFTIDENTGNVYVADFHQVHRFSKEGVFISSFKTDFTGSFVTCNDNELIFYGYGFEDNKLIITDLNGNIRKKYIQPSQKYYLVCGTHFHNYSNKTLFHLPPVDTIFQIANSNYEPHCIVDFGKYAFTMDDYEKLKPEQRKHLSSYLSENGNFLRLSTFIETDSNIFIQIYNKNKLFSGIYDKIRNTKTIINHKNIENDIFESQFYFNVVGKIENTFILYVPAYNIIKSSKQNFIENHLIKTKSMKNIDLYSNPVLMIVKPK